MTKALTPEVLNVTQAYIECQHSIAETAEMLNLSEKEVFDQINHPEAKQFLREVYLDSGYRNKGKIGALMDKIIESKLEEAEESGIYSDADLIEILKLQHKMRMDEAKLDTANTQVNIANFNDSNYGELMNRLMNGKGK